MSGISENRQRLSAKHDSDRVSRLQLYDGERDLHDTLGYNDTPGVEEFWQLYNRADIAKAIIEKPVKATWSQGVSVFDAGDSEVPDEGDDDLRDEFDQLKRESGLISELTRADIVSRIGRHGVMVLGVNDGRSLEQPLGEASELKYVTPMSERRIQDFDLGENPTDPRYNLPVRWHLDFEDDQNREVHWTRVIHIAEQQREHAVYQVPILRPVYNRVMDWQKVIGGAAEMFWRGADRKMVATLDPDAGRLDDEDDLAAQIEEMRHGLRDTVYGRGLGIDQLDGEDVDPTGVKDAILDAISSETDIPKRILIGSERGELASTQDRANFYGNMEDRRRQHAGPNILRPFVNRLQRADILPETNFKIHWPNVFVLDEMEKAEIASQKAQAVERLNDVDWIDDDEKRELVGLSE